jgi:hypothetical protein
MGSSVLASTLRARAGFSLQFVTLETFNLEELSFNRLRPGHRSRLRDADQALAALSNYAAFPIPSRTCVRYAGPVGTWHDLDVGRPIAAPLERCAELLGVDLTTIREAAANVEPYLRADGTRIWSLMQLERQLRPEVYRRRRGGYLDRRRTPATDA